MWNLQWRVCRWDLPVVAWQDDGAAANSPAYPDNSACKHYLLQHTGESPRLSCDIVDVRQGTVKRKISEAATIFNRKPTNWRPDRVTVSEEIPSVDYLFSFGAVYCIRMSQCNFSVDILLEYMVWTVGVFLGNTWQLVCNCFLKF